MKIIPLTKGYQTMVDDEDYDVLSKYRWCAKPDIRRGVIMRVYVTRNVLSTEIGYDSKIRHKINMHRQILNLTSSDKVLIDHIDSNTLNNQKFNLRLCTPSQNNCNSRKYRGCKHSKYKGICYKKKIKRWTAYIDCDRRRYNIGCFMTEKEAAFAYNEEAIKRHGQFANLNIIID